MSEYIISDEQLGLIRDFATVCVEGEKLPRIVRCRDCYHYRDISTKHARSGGIGTCDLGLEWTDLYSIVEPSGFCAWGTKTEFVTCKCGEDIERIDRIQICPSCGRKVRA